MTTFTIHVEDPLAAAIRNGASETGQSINMFIKNTLCATLGLVNRKERPLPDFFDFGPPLSKEAADELRATQKDFEVIDEEMWK